jgi:hypothetical protein
MTTNPQIPFSDVQQPGNARPVYEGAWPRIGESLPLPSVLEQLGWRTIPAPGGNAPLGGDGSGPGNPKAATPQASP